MIHVTISVDASTPVRTIDSGGSHGAASVGVGDISLIGTTADLRRVLTAAVEQLDELTVARRHQARDNTNG